MLYVIRARVFNPGAFQIFRAIFCYSPLHPWSAVPRMQFICYAVLKISGLQAEIIIITSHFLRCIYRDHLGHYVHFFCCKNILAAFFIEVVIQLVIR